MMELLDLTIKELHRELVNKTITPLDLVEEALKRARQDNNNAFEVIMEKEALEAAFKLTKPEANNPLWGIPFAIKDNFSVKDVPATASSNILSGYTPIFNATVVDKLLAKHAILIGKTTLDELAMGGSGTTGHLGKTYNPYDPSHRRMIGGSSCGSAAVVSSSITPFALGSDTGDSVRKPASYSGLVGFKATWGRISRYGLFPFAPSLDHVGYFTRSVYDAASLLNVLAGRDEKDSTSSSEKVIDFTSLLNEGIKGKKIGIIKEIIDSINDKVIFERFQQLIFALRNRGALVQYISFPKQLLETIYPTYIVISCAEATSNNANLDGIKFGPFYNGKTYQEVMMNARSRGFSELIKRRFVIGSFALMRENQDVLFLRAQKNRRLIVNTLNKIMEQFDVLLLPGAPTPAPLFEGSSDRLSDEYLIADNHLVLGNFAGLPSLTIPIGLEDSLPFSANVMGKKFREAEVFQVGQAIEDITGLYNLSAKAVLK